MRVGSCRIIAGLAVLGALPACQTVTDKLAHQQRRLRTEPAAVVPASAQAEAADGSGEREVATCPPVATPERTEKPERAEQAQPREPAARKTPPSRRWRLSLTRRKGAGPVVRAVDPRSPVAALLRRGDVISTVDGRSLANGVTLEQYLDTLPSGMPVLLEVRRNGSRRTVLAQVPYEEGEAPARVAPAATTAAPAPQAPLVAPTVVVQAPGAPPGFSGAYGAGGGSDADLGARPPAFAAPGLTQVPGATFAPGPATPAQAFPQLPGISQPPGFGILIRPGVLPGTTTGTGTATTGALGTGAGAAGVGTAGTSAVGPGGGTPLTGIPGTVTTGTGTPGTGIAGPGAPGTGTTGTGTTLPGTRAPSLSGAPGGGRGAGPRGTIAPVGPARPGGPPTR